MKNPLISVCIPVFNGEKYIRESISSVLLQSERNFELLIIDNCSTDQTWNICKEFTDLRIRILKNTSNVGSIENFNKCIQNATGELFILLPADDLLEKDCLGMLSKGFADNPSVGIAFAPTLQINDQGKTIRANHVLHQDGLLDRKEALQLIVENWNPIHHPMVRLNVFTKVGRFDPSFAAFCDIHLWLRVLFDGWDAYVVSKPLTSLRSHEDQGQMLFRRNTKENLKKLGDHYGCSLPSDFFRRNHSSLQFAKLVQFFNRCHESSFGARNPVEKVMITTLVRSHLGNLYFSLRHFNLSGCIAEITLSVKLMKAYGLVRICNSYFSILISMFRKTLIPV